jgi:hypothetical protein
MWEVAHTGGATLEDDMDFETDVIGNTSEIVYTNKRLIQQDHESLLLAREVPSHLQSHFRIDNFDSECDQSLEAPDGLNLPDGDDYFLK